MAYIIHETTEDSEYLYHSPGVSGRVILSRDPVNSSEAVTKKYVDDALELHCLNIRHLNSDEKTFLDSLSLNSVDFGYIERMTENPQTAIDRKLSKVGGVVTGEILSVASPVNDLDCVTKELCDSLDVVFPSNVGDIYQSTNIAAPPQHLLCDGSLKSKTTYSNLFNIIGDIYETKTLNRSNVSTNYTVTIHKSIPRIVNSYTEDVFTIGSRNCDIYPFDKSNILAWWRGSSWSLDQCRIVWAEVGQDARNWVNDIPHESAARYSGIVGESNDSWNFQYYSGPLSPDATELHTLIDSGYGFPRLIKHTDGTPLCIVMCATWNHDNSGRNIVDTLVNYGFYKLYADTNYDAYNWPFVRPFIINYKNSNLVQTTVYDQVDESVTVTANKLDFSEVPTNTDPTLFRLPNIPPYVEDGVTVYNYIRY